MEHKMTLAERREFFVNELNGLKQKHAETVVPELRRELSITIAVYENQVATFDVEIAEKSEQKSRTEKFECWIKRFETVAVISAIFFFLGSQVFADSDLSKTADDGYQFMSKVHLSLFTLSVALLTSVTLSKIWRHRVPLRRAASRFVMEVRRISKL